MKPGRVATPSRASSSTRPAPSRSGSRRTGRRRRGRSDRRSRSPRSESTVRGYGSRRTSSSGERGARELEPDVCRQLDVLVPGSLGDEHGQPRQLEALLRAPARARRARCAAGRTRRRRARSLPLERLLADLDLVALARAGRLEDRLELGRVGRASLDAEAAVGAEDAVRASRAAAAGRRGSRRAPLVRRDGTISSLRDELEERALQLVDAGARGGGDAQRPRRCARRRRRMPAASGIRSILFSTTTCGRVSRPAPYAASSASIVRQRSVGVALGRRRSRAAAGARARGARGTRGRARCLRSRPRSARARRRP